MYNTIKLEEKLYSITGKTFTQALADLDPDINYKGTELEGLDAFERQLKRFDIKITGKNSNMVEAFFMNSETAVLFPEYVRRTVKQGMEEASIFSDIAATISYIDAIDYRSFSVSTTSSNTNSTSQQASNLKSSTVTLDSPAKEMTKYGRSLNFSYESIRKQRLDAVGVILKQMGAQIAREMNVAAIDELTEDVTASTISGTEFTFSDIATFWSEEEELNMSLLVVSPATLAKILTFDEMRDCQFDYVSGNAVKTPFGMTIVKCPGMDDSVAVGIDKTCGVEVVFGTELIVETEKEILKQCNRVTTSITVGFSKLTDGAVAVLNLTNS